MSPAPRRVATGLDQLSDDGFPLLRGRRVGAICNPTSVDRNLDHLADLLHARRDCTLVALFGPEHGIRGDAQDMVGVESHHDPRTGIVVHSLYGSSPESLAPTAEQLDGIDLLVFDVQDVGSRYYTFAATMLHAMRAAARQGIAFVVLDRPNPIGGIAIEGPTVQPGYESFVGAHPVPIRHGLTIGELAQLFQAECRLDLDLTVVPCAGWSRTMLWDETGIPWVAPSPNMPTPETALVYPGGCLLEGTNLSEGRGTTHPFEWWGAPWFQPWGIRDAHYFPGALLRYCAFRPTFHKFAGTTCYGVQFHVIDPALFRPVRAYTQMIALLRRDYPDRFAWRTEPYEFVAEPIAIDLLYGSARERMAIDGGMDPKAIAEAWAPDERAFRERREPYLCYRE